MLPRHLAGVVFVLTTLLSGAGPARAGDAPSRPGAYRVVVHPASPVVTLDRKTLRNIFLKKITQWPDGQVIHPVDLEPSQEVRRGFSAEVLERSVEAVKSYWQQAIFSGRDVPPPELDSGEAVVKYVLAHKGAIGYVSVTVDPGGTKAVTVR
jgi:ABC-type phosphate transport system substrate-binding protein